jgi:hypothetical protein
MKWPRRTSSGLRLEKMREDTVVHLEEHGRPHLTAPRVANQPTPQELNHSSKWIWSGFGSDEQSVLCTPNARLPADPEEERRRTQGSNCD